MCKIFTPHEDAEIRKIVLDAYIECQQDEAATRMILQQAKINFDAETTGTPSPHSAADEDDDEDDEGSYDIFYTCNGCEKDINEGEYRYHCQQCPDFDFCSDCRNKHTPTNPLHDVGHIFAKLYVFKEEHSGESDNEDDEEADGEGRHATTEAGQKGEEKTAEKKAPSYVHVDSPRPPQQLFSSPITPLTPASKKGETEYPAWGTIAAGAVVLGGLSVAGYLLWKRGHK